MKYRWTWRNIRQMMASKVYGFYSEDDWDISDDGHKTTVKKHQLWGIVKIIESAKKRKTKR